MNEKRIVLEPNKPAKFSGAWRVGEVLAQARMLVEMMETLEISAKTFTPPETKPNE